ncbi:Pectate lyase superfamily protein [compost metagenome]
MSLDSYVSASSPINVFAGNYGATSGDSSDDSAAIQAALDAVEANPGGGKVTLLSGGSYIISTPLFIGKDVLLHGNGATIKRRGTFNDVMVTLSDDNASVYELTIDGNYLSQRGIQVQSNVHYADIYKNTIKNITQGGQTSSELTVGIMVGTGADYVNIDQNTIQNIKAVNSSQPVSRGIMLSTYGGVIAQHANVTSNTITNISPKDDGDGIFFDSGTNPSVNSVIAWNTIQQVGKRGIKVASPGVTVNGNHITNSYSGNNTLIGDDPAEGYDMYSAISVYANDVTVINNTIDGIGSFYATIEAQGFNGEYVNNLSISNNYIYSETQSGSAIRLDDASNFSIQNNIIDNANKGVFTYGNGRTGLIDRNTITNAIVGLALETYISNKYLDHVTVTNNNISAISDINNASTNTNMIFINNN